MWDSCGLRSPNECALDFYKGKVSLRYNTTGLTLNISYSPEIVYIRIQENEAT
jgi:hypothetical protein